MLLDSMPYSRNAYWTAAYHQLQAIWPGESNQPDGLAGQTGRSSAW